jgi:hypothetical protein
MLSVIPKSRVPEKRAYDPDDKEDDWAPGRSHLHYGLDPESQILEARKDPCICP